MTQYHNQNIHTFITHLPSSTCLCLYLVLLILSHIDVHVSTTTICMLRCYIPTRISYVALFFKDLIFKQSVHPTWGSNSQPQDQEPHAPLTEPARQSYAAFLQHSLPFCPRHHNFCNSWKLLICSPPQKCCH